MPLHVKKFIAYKHLTETSKSSLTHAKTEYLYFMDGKVPISIYIFRSKKFLNFFPR